MANPTRGPPQVHGAKVRGGPADVPESPDNHRRNQLEHQDARGLGRSEATSALLSLSSRCSKPQQLAKF